MNFKIWLSNNNFFTNEEKLMIAARLEVWEKYGSVGEFAAWLSEFGRARHPDKIEVLHLNFVEKMKHRKAINAKNIEASEETAEEYLDDAF